MKVNYFEYKGKKYYAGTEFQMYYTGYKMPRSSCRAVFLWRDPDEDIIMYRVYSVLGEPHVCGNTTQGFFKDFIGITKESDGSIGVPESKRIKDSQIPKLVIGWAWYILIMLFLVVTNIWLIGWVGVSVIFFTWRKGVIEREGYYYDWPI